MEDPVKREINLMKLVRKNFIRRCTDPKDKQWNDYGGRGIGVCDRWLESFDNFLADMGMRPLKYQIDRIDNDGNYEPSNCRWVTKKENCQNRRPPRVLRPRPHRKLTPDQVREIRKDPRPSKEIGPIYGVNGRTINSLLAGKTYKDVT